MYYDLPNPKKNFFSKSSRPPNPNRTEARPTPKLTSIASSTSTNHLTLTPRKYPDLQGPPSKVSLNFVKLKGAARYKNGSPIKKGYPFQVQGLFKQSLRVIR